FGRRGGGRVGPAARRRSGAAGSRAARRLGRRALPVARRIGRALDRLRGRRGDERRDRDRALRRRRLRGRGRPRVDAGALELRAGDHGRGHALAPRGRGGRRRLGRPRALGGWGAAHRRRSRPARAHRRCRRVRARSGRRDRGGREGTRRNRHVFPARARSPLNPPSRSSKARSCARVSLVSSRRSTAMLRKLEKYEILEEIGHGGMATVYRATDTVLDRPVALKVMHPHLRAAEEARKRFHREARSVARLRHPRVLEIYDFSGEGSSEAYIAAELLTGPTLKQWREGRGEVPAEIAACAVIQVAQALEAAPAAGIVHRDVKPEHVHLHKNRAPKPTDLGIADMIDAQSMTATGQILGSPGHMAPEQIEGKDCDARSDLFSLGTVLYYLATGRLPFTGRNPHQVLKRIVDGEYADPLRVN